MTVRECIKSCKKEYTTKDGWCHLYRYRVEYSDNNELVGGGINYFGDWEIENYMVSYGDDEMIFPVLYMWVKRGKYE